MRLLALLCDHPDLPDVSRTRRTDLPETVWASSALCADMPAEIFDAAGDLVQTAKAACAHCPVTRQCLRWAVSHEVEDEIWGARTPRERRRLSMAFVLEPPDTDTSMTDKPQSTVAPISAGMSAHNALVAQLVSGRSVRRVRLTVASCPGSGLGWMCSRGAG